MRELVRPIIPEISITCPCGVAHRYKLNTHIITGECVCGRMFVVTTPIKYLEGT